MRIAVNNPHLILPKKNLNINLKFKVMKKKWKDCFPCRGKYVKIFRIMKLCTCLLFCSMMTLSAGVRGQHIKMSLDMKGVTLEEVIWTLEKKSDITFFYNVSDVSKVTNVSAVFKDASLEAILDMLLKGTNLYYEMQSVLLHTP